ncbi:MAG: hypothetical protein MRK01_02890 [Candidatus Scalindua sp.]|nr:hypothetical protein [Candidatus Scalindua sp.]
MLNKFYNKLGMHPIYSMCQELAENKLGCPPPDESLKEIKEVTEAFNKVSDKFE